MRLGACARPLRARTTAIGVHPTGAATSPMSDCRLRPRAGHLGENFCRTGLSQTYAAIGILLRSLEATTKQSVNTQPPGVIPAELVPPVRRVRKAYEQVGDQLRELILSGQMSPGERLPSETALAREFGVSRATVREALRLLAAQQLIRTKKGVAGGSYVTLPSVEHISDVVQAAIALLSESHDLSLHEFLEIRELLEVPAARLAAERRNERDLERIVAAIPSRPLSLGTQEQFGFNSDFHSVLIQSCGNTLLTIAAQPIFTVLQNNLARSTLGSLFHQTINVHHLAIARAIEAGDTRAAEREMRDHLTFLRPFYERGWRNAVAASNRRK